VLCQDGSVIGIRVLGTWQRISDLYRRHFEHATTAVTTDTKDPAIAPKIRPSGTPERAESFMVSRDITFNSALMILGMMSEAQGELSCTTTHMKVLVDVD